ncbi:putative RNA-directed DNA polymerase, eukaryota, reverse transcriptase zinc-binding domain protein, partial [Tanacetum coccineum]
MSNLDRFFITEGVALVFLNISSIALDNTVSYHRPILLTQTTIDKGVADSDDLASRSRARANLNSLEVKDMKDISQKSKIKWSIEGDENSSFYHGILNSKRGYLAIRSIKWEGEWILMLVSPTYKSLNEQQGDDLTSSISMEEFKKAVWSSGNDKAPGPDGFTFSLIKRYWDIFKNDVFNHVLEFFSTGFIPSRCNSSYITLIPKVINPMYVGDYHPISLIGIQYKIIAKIMAIRLAKVIDSVVSMEQTAFIKGRQILDGPMMVNEIIGWYKKKKKRAMILKVDFEKSFDSLSWEFLDRTMEFMCFPKKWRDWIHACLHSARASILINGSPTKEFRLDRGLRQGDPLSPFLFIISMEGLHVAIEDAKNAGLFHGLRIGNDCLHLSHLLYADDVMFMGEWSHSNVQNLLMILHYFFMSLGLKINLHKSNIYVIEVTTNDVSSLASDFVIQPYHGGLGIGSLEAFNIALLLKWWWRKFWEDYLVDGIILSRQYTHLYALEIHKHCMVAENWNNGDWFWSWRRQIRGGYEQA